MTAEAETTELSCPTCGAKQGFATECRRCKCNLTLVTAALRQCQAIERECVARLRQGEFALALSAARQRWTLAPDEVAARYLAVCYTLLGRYQAALDVADALPEASGRA